MLEPMISFSTFDKPRAHLGVRLLRRAMIVALVLFGLLKWLFFGALVRRNLRQAERSGRIFYLDNLPSGRNPQA